MNISYGVSSEVGPRWRMEDAHRVVKDSELGVFGAEVFDGHIDAAAAEVASAFLADYFLKEYRREQEKPPSQRRSVSELIKDAYLAGDAHITQNGIHSGTAAASFYIIGETFWAANAGDARIVMGAGPEARALTVDHRPSLPSERERVEALGGRVISFDIPRVEGDLALSRTLGDVHLKPFVTPTPRIAEGYLGKENDFVIVACDGIWDVLPQEDVLSVARKAASPEKAAKSIIIAALEAGSFDNMTVIVLDLRDYVSGLSREKMEIVEDKDWEFS